jgi:Ca-activated chloride channel family protein
MIPAQAFAPLSWGFPLALLAAPLALVLFYLTWRKAGAALIPTISLVKTLPRSIKLRLRLPLLGVLATSFILLLSAAAARPQRVTQLESGTKRRNLVLALDASRSMEAVDFSSGSQQLSRMTAVKRVVRQFIQARAEDRIGVVVFGSKAFVQAPLTLDHQLLLDLISDLSPRIAGDGTAIGDGLGLSLKRLREAPADSSTVILLTDGVSNSGQLDPLEAAEIAKAAGIKVHTIGIGSNRDILTPGLMGIMQGAQQAEFDEGPLKQIAATTGGSYFNAQDLEGLAEVYRQIDELERTSSKDPQQRLVDERFTPWCLAALAAYLLYLLCARVWLLRVPS